MHYNKSRRKLSVVANTGIYQYFVKDHLGNVRLVIAESMVDAKSEILELNHYYPFGMRMAMHNSKKLANQHYLYNGKEKQEETGWLDYGARMYDASLGRFFTQDRFAEDYCDLSVYQYTANNPILFIDVNGDYIFINGEDDKRYKYESGSLYSKNDDGDWVEYKAEKGSYLATIQVVLNKLAIGEDGESLVGFFTGEKNHINFRQRKEGEEGSGNQQSGWSVVTDKNPEGGIIPTEEGLSKSPLHVAVGHEMAHRQDRINGTFSDKPWYKISGFEIPEAEKYATHYENKIRAEQGLPLRTHYSRDNTQGNGPVIIQNGKSSFYRQYGVAFDYRYRVYRRKFLRKL
ncbi:MAG: M91 family zinc metallopeptidase [Marinifilaceae bacterium]|jgi:RHS repeat-associated protein|nr:M91 family zinc metallopeptidase [Marinifilaceae bacterium]